MPRNASAAFADKAQNEGFPMISSQVRAQMPIISVVALGALVAALLLHASYALAQSSAGAPDRYTAPLRPTRRGEEKWPRATRHSLPRARLQPGSWRFRLMARSRRASTVPSPGRAMTR